MISLSIMIPSLFDYANDSISQQYNESGEHVSRDWLNPDAPN